MNTLKADAEKTPVQQKYSLGHRRQEGATLIVSVMILMIVIAGLIIVASSFMLSSRRTTADQKVIIPAQYAADSGIAYAKASYLAARDIITTPTTKGSFADLKNALGKICTTPIFSGSTVWDASKTNNSGITAQYKDTNFFIRGKKLCDISDITSTAQLKFFQDYYPSNGSKFVSYGIKPDDVSDFILRVFSDSIVGIEYDDKTRLNMSSLIKPFALTAVEKNTFRIYFTIPEIHSTGTFAKVATRVKNKKSQEEPYYIQVKVSTPKKGGEHTKYAYLMGGRKENRRRGSGQNQLACEDYFEGPAHANTFLRINVGSFCRSAANRNESMGPIFNGDLTSTGCTEPERAFDFHKPPKPQKTDCYRDSKKSSKGYLKSNANLSINTGYPKYTGIVGGRGPNRWKNAIKLPGLLIRKSVNYGHVPNRGKNFQGYGNLVNSRSFFYLILGFNPLDGKPGKVNFHAPYVKIPVPESQISTNARDNGIYIKGNVEIVELLTSNTSPRYQEIKLKKFCDGPYHHFHLRIKDKGELEINKNGRFVPAVIDPAEIQHKCINIREAKSGESSSTMSEPIIFAGNNVKSLTGVQRTNNNTVPTQPSIAKYANITVVAKNNITITGDIIYEAPPCTLNVPCPRNSSGEYDARNMLGIYAQYGDIVLAYTAAPKILGYCSQNINPQGGSLCLPPNPVIDAFMLTSRGQVGFGTALFRVRPTSMPHRVTFRGGVTTAYAGVFRDDNQTYQSYKFDKRGLEMSPAGFPGGGDLGDDEPIKNLQVAFGAEGTDKGDTTTTDPKFYGEWLQGKVETP